jgi:hypothetical protein
MSSSQKVESFAIWSELLWQSWSGSLAELTNRECLELFAENARAKSFLHFIQGIEFEFFRYLMDERDWDQALLYAYLDAKNMRDYFLDICEIYVEHYLKTGYISELLVEDFLQSGEGQEFIQTHTGDENYLNAMFEQLKFSHRQ